MTAHTDARPFAALDSCPCCGVHRWSQDVQAYLEEHVVCGECNFATGIEDVTPVAVGRD